MSVLRTIESKLESLFEGVFGRAFRTNVQPVELARKLVKEMDDHRTVSVSRVYVPNEYTIYLSPPDREQFADFEDVALRGARGLPRRARAARGLRAADAAAVKLETDADLDLGVFGIATRLVRGAARRSTRTRRTPRSSRARRWSTRRSQPRGGVAGGREPPRSLRETATLTFEGTKHELDERRVVIGRSKDCDVQLDDPNVSRRHAEVRQEGATYWLVDLDSTNGVEVNGKRVKRAQARGRHALHDRLDRDPLLAGARLSLAVPVGSAQVETTLLALKFAFLVLLYLFIWRIVRSAARDLRLPQESMILLAAAGRAAPARSRPRRELGRLIVVASPALEEGAVYSIDQSSLTIGRGADNDVSIDGDEYASTRHARFEPRRDGVYVEDVGSTNGTFVNGIRLTRERRLTPGDVVRVGETDLRFEQ